LIRSVVVLVLLIALWIVFATQGRNPIVTNVIMATALDDRYRPVEVTETYTPADTFFASIEVKGVDGDEPLLARWIYEGEEITTSPLASDLAGDLYAGFVLTNQDTPWPVGRYRVDILYEDDVLGSANFSVVEEATSDD
jgi:hypothetical protein